MTPRERAEDLERKTHLHKDEIPLVVDAIEAAIAAVAITDIITSGTVTTCANCVENARKASAAIEAQNRAIDLLKKQASLWMEATRAWKKWGSMSTRECSAENFRVALERAIHAEDAALAIPQVDVSLDSHSKETK